MTCRTDCFSKTKYQSAGKALKNEKESEDKHEAAGNGTTPLTGKL